MPQFVLSLTPGETVAPAEVKNHSPATDRAGYRIYLSNMAKECKPLGESSPLLPSSSSDNELSPRSDSKATFFFTVINMMKTCMGTGCLALAYAAQQGGLILYIVGVVAIAAWNVVCIDRLDRCLLLTRSKEQLPPTGTSTLSQVAWFAFGSVGLHILDATMVWLLIGILVTYVIAVVSFVEDTPWSWNVYIDSLLTGLAMGAISLVPDFSYLAKASTIGLVVLAGVLFVIAGYGLSDSANLFDQGEIEIDLLPGSWAGLSHWFGIVVFGYGTVPLTYNFKESMNEPARLVEASAVAVTLVALLYLILGVGFYVLFPDLKADILHEIPDTGWIPFASRLALSATVVATGTYSCSEFQRLKTNSNLLSLGSTASSHSMFSNTRREMESAP